MKRFWLVGLAALALAGCETLLDPSLTEAERNMLSFDAMGIKMGSSPGELARFSQVSHIPVKLNGYDVYEVYNVAPNLSEIKAWYYNRRLVRLELRYFNGPGTSTLARAGGWDGIRDYLFEKFGPPSRFGTDVPIIATKGEWNAKYARFNGEWIFSRIHRQINYSAMADSKGGIAVVTILDTTPIPVQQERTQATTTTRRTVSSIMAESKPAPTPQPVNPGF